MAIDKIVRVGLTGGIGSGKTSISKAFQAIGIPVYNSDLRSRELSNTDERIIAGLKQQFGDDIYQLGQLTESGCLNSVQRYCCFAANKQTDSSNSRIRFY